MSRILGLDVGDKRIGVALSDEMQLTAQPHSTLDTNKSHDSLMKLIRNYSISVIVIGQPLMPDGSIGEQARKVEKFIDKFLKSLHKNGLSEVSIHLVDERFTSAQAQRVLVGSKLRGKDKRSATDRIAAALILESYLQMQHLKY